MCCQALWWCMITPILSILHRLFWMALCNFCSVSQLCSTFNVLPLVRKSMRRMPIPEHRVHHFLCQQCLLEFSLAWRSTVMPMHWLLLGFWGNVCNPHFITCDDLVQKLIAVIMVLLQKCQCWLHALCFAFWCQLLRHSPGTQFSEQQVLRDTFVQQGAGNYCWVP